MRGKQECLVYELLLIQAKSLQSVRSFLRLTLHT
jgi:hypothetical protein